MNSRSFVFEIIFIICVFFAGYFFKHVQMKNTIYAQYLEIEKMIAEEKDRYAEVLKQHQADQLVLLHEINSLVDEYETAIHNINVTNSDRMRQSEERNRVLRQRLQAGEVGPKAIADHATRLDTALTEGIGLVEELATTIRRRDSELKSVSEYLVNDRNHLNER